MLKLYVLFEKAVAGVLLLGMCVVILLATWSFVLSFAEIGDLAGGLQYAFFQVLFDRVLAALIALELAHSVLQMVEGKHGLTQVKTVVVIGILAVVRKLILLEIETTSGVFLLGLGAAVFSLGAVYAMISWMESDGRVALAAKDERRPGG